MSFILRLGNVSSGYGKFQVLKQISLEVRDNQIVSILGANGAGKSTLLKTISGLLKHTNGSMMFHGENIKGLHPSEVVKKGLIHIPEGRGTFPELTVEENLKLGTYRHKRNDQEDQQHVYEYFPILYERRKQLAGHLSGGEQQMLAIGRALMAKPKFLMIDEPSLGLSPKMVNQVFDIISKIRKEGISILLVEQNTDLALQISDYCYVLRLGQVVMDGRSERVKYNDELRKSYLGA